MRIPLAYGQFPHPTLIAVTDNSRARLFLARENTIEEIGLLESGYPPANNFERTSGQSPAGSHFAEQSENLKIIAREKLYRSLSEDLMRRSQNHEFSDLILAAPEEQLNDLRESLHIDLVKKTKAFIPKLLTGQETLDIALYAREAANE